MDERLFQLMDDLIAQSKAAFGESEYAYFKKHIIWSPGRKRGDKGSHFRPIGDGVPITKDEYDANIAEAKRIGVEAFMGRYQRAYWDYDKKLTRPGWREKLLEIVKNLPDSASTESK